MIVEPWLTPFLSFVHAVCRQTWVRRLMPKINALATILVVIVAMGALVAGIWTARQQKIRDRDAQMALAANQQMIESLKKA